MAWMRVNKLRLKSDKMEALVVVPDSTQESGSALMLDGVVGPSLQFGRAPGPRPPA